MSRLLERYSAPEWVEWLALLLGVVAALTWPWFQARTWRKVLFWVCVIAYGVIAVVATVLWPDDVNARIESKVDRIEQAVASGVKVKIRRHEEVEAISDGNCPFCRDEINLDGAGTLYIKEAKRTLVVMALTERPTVDLINPTPGVVPLPRDSSQQSPWTTTAKLPPSGQRGGNAQSSTITLMGTAKPGTKGGPPSISVEAIGVPPEFQGSLKTRGPDKEVFRFDYSSVRRHTVVASGRTFFVTFTNYSEGPTVDGKRRIFRYTFDIAEQ